MQETVARKFVWLKKRSSSKLCIHNLDPDRAKNCGYFDKRIVFGLDSFFLITVCIGMTFTISNIELLGSN